MCNLCWQLANHKTNKQKKKTKTIEMSSGRQLKWFALTTTQTCGLKKGFCHFFFLNGRSNASVHFAHVNFFKDLPVLRRRSEQKLSH